MNKELLNTLTLALENKASANFSSDDVNSAAINGILAECGLNENATPREIRAVEDRAFALIEEAVDAVLPKKIEQVLGEFAEVKSFARDAEVLFNIEKVGKNRAKLTVMKGARGGIYKAAKLDSKFFSPSTSVYTVAVYVTLEEIILGTASLGELYANVLEGFEEIIYKEVFNALASGAPVLGTSRIGGNSISTTKADLGSAIDVVMPKVKQYGVPTIFGSYEAVSSLENYGTTAHVELADAAEKRTYGFVQLYKGARVVELPNYLVDETNSEWFYDRSYVFVIPSDAKPVKVALKGDLVIVENTQATGSVKREAHKMLGVGLAMANNYSVIKVSDID